MTAPVKPWEMMNADGLGREPPLTSGGGSNLRASGNSLGGLPPPLPPRPGGGRPGGWRVPMSIYPTAPGLSYLGGYPSHSPYAYTSSYPRRQDDYETRFLQVAEESSEPAFRSIEAVVRSISSVAMMLESTYQAMYTSFRAVLSVADNLSRLRRVFAQLVCGLSIVNSLRWLCNNLLYILGLVSHKRVSEEAWKAAEEKASAAAKAGAVAAAGGEASIWPVVAFFGLILGGPYLVFKYLAPGSRTPPTPEWEPGADGGSPAVAVYDFETTRPGELALRRGQHLLVEPDWKRRQGGWVMAARGQTRGLVPANRIALLTRETCSVDQAANESESQTNDRTL